MLTAEQLTQGLSNGTELLHRRAELGWLGVSIPVNYGGGAGPTATQTLRKALAPPICHGANEINSEIIGKNLGL